MKLPRAFIIYDMEYTSWNGSMERNWNHDWEKREIIQIAAVKVLNYMDSLEILETFNVIVKPTYNPILSNYITNLTGITNKQINSKGIPFKAAIKKFYKFCEKPNKKLIKIFSYGDDYKIIMENLILNKVHKNSKLYKLRKKSYDIRKILKSYIDVDNYTSGSLYTHYHIEHENSKIHNAIWDVYSIFLTLNYMLKYGYDI